jgi:hypothetical protein
MVSLSVVSASIVLSWINEGDGSDKTSWSLRHTGFVVRREDWEEGADRKPEKEMESPEGSAQDDTIAKFLNGETRKPRSEAVPTPTPKLVISPFFPEIGDSKNRPPLDKEHFTMQQLYRSDSRAPVVHGVPVPHIRTNSQSAGGSFNENALESVMLRRWLHTTFRPAANIVVVPSYFFHLRSEYLHTGKDWQGMDKASRDTRAIERYWKQVGAKYYAASQPATSAPWIVIHWNYRCRLPYTALSP